VNVTLALSGKRREQRGPDLVVGERIVVSGARAFRCDEAQVDGIAQVFPDLELVLGRAPIDVGQDT
jgi:hypothetical protein